MEARRIQSERFRGSNIRCNAEMTNRQIEKYCNLNEDEKRLMQTLMETLSLSMRAYHRIIKVARTIADIDGCPLIENRHLMEAAGYRILDKTPTN